MVWPNLITALIAGIFTGSITAYNAHRKKRHPIPWFIIGFYFGLLGLLFFFLIPEKEKQAPPIPLKPQPRRYIFGPTDKYWYFLDASQSQVGPMSYTALSNHWKQGKIKPDTLVWHEELTDWKPLAEFIRTEETLA